jgi:hypothetical protein
MIARVIAGAPVGGVGLVFLVIGAVLARTTRRFQRIAQRTKGRIVSLDTTRRGATGGWQVSSTGYYPTVRFTTAEGQEVTAQSHFGSNPPPGRVGETVGVLYDPADPKRVRVDTMLGRGGIIGPIFVGIGAVLIVAAVFVLVSGS